MKGGGANRGGRQIGAVAKSGRSPNRGQTPKFRQKAPEGFGVSPRFAPRRQSRICSTSVRDWLILIGAGLVYPVLVTLLLKFLFGAIFLWMTAATIRASLDVSLFAAWPAFAANPWAVATLYDAYFGFLTFYVWVLYKERRAAMRVLWFLLVMALGNIAMSLYVLIQLFRLPSGESAETILWRKA